MRIPYIPLLFIIAYVAGSPFVIVKFFCEMMMLLVGLDPKIKIIGNNGEVVRESKWQGPAGYDGQKRLVRKFLFLPVLGEDDGRMNWMRFAVVIQSWEFNGDVSNWSDHCVASLRDKIDA